MNEGVLLNDGEGNIRRAFVPITSVIVRDDPTFKHMRPLSPTSSASTPTTTVRPPLKRNSVPSFMAPTAASASRNKHSNPDDDLHNDSTFSVTEALRKPLLHNGPHSASPRPLGKQAGRHASSHATLSTSRMTLDASERRRPGRKPSQAQSSSLSRAEWGPEYVHDHRTTLLSSTGDEGTMSDSILSAISSDGECSAPSVAGESMNFTTALECNATRRLISLIALESSTRWGLHDVEEQQRAAVLDRHMDELAELILLPNRHVEDADELHRNEEVDDLGLIDKRTHESSTAALVAPAAAPLREFAAPSLLPNSDRATDAAATENPPDSLPDLPPHLQQYLQALHFRTVALSAEVLRVTQSHSEMQSALSDAQHEISRLRSNVAAVASTAANDDEAMKLPPVHPAILAASRSRTHDSAAPVTVARADRLGAKRGDDNDEGVAVLGVEGSGSVAKSLFLMLAYPLQCCMRSSSTEPPHVEATSAGTRVNDKEHGSAA